VLAAVDYYREQFSAPSIATPEKVIQNFAEMANVDISSTVDSQWNVKSVDDLPPDVRRAITGIEVRETKGTRRVILKFAKMEANDHLARILQLYGDANSNRDGFTLNITMAGDVPRETTDQPPPEATIGLSFNGESFQ
jgi:hypothetical protein